MYSVKQLTTYFKVLLSVIIGAVAVPAKLNHPLISKSLWSFSLFYFTKSNS
jgi:hypothetical protein